MCQQIDDERHYSLGSVASMVWWLNQSTPYYIFSIEYDHGDEGRYIEKLRETKDGGGQRKRRGREREKEAARDYRKGRIVDLSRRKIGGL